LNFIDYCVKNKYNFIWCIKNQPLICTLLTTKIKIYEKILTLAFVGMLSFSAFSQKGTSFSVGLEAGLPMGTFGDGNKLGLGGSVKAAFPSGDKGAFTASAGYISFGGKDVVIPAVTFGGVVIMPEQTISGAAANLIPVKVGYRYMLSDASVLSRKLVTLLTLVVVHSLMLLELVTSLATLSI